jgi:threonylcarbamoyladenosine tRNA methylthiotransferase MtaB
MSENTAQGTTFAVTTLGCKVNQADSEAISDQMNAAGFVQRDFTESADVYIVNTCTVTHLGDRSSRQLIAQAHRRHPDALLVVTGCYAELNPTAVAKLPGVSLVVGNSGKDTLIENIKSHLPQHKIGTEEGEHQAIIDEALASAVEAVETGKPTRRILPMVSFDTQHIGSDSALTWQDVDEEPQPENPARLSPFTSNVQTSELASNRIFSRTRVQMKVQDGCDNRCTYCIVPTVRGKSRSRSLASVVENVQRKTRAGFQEIVLTGIHLGDYHPDEERKLDLGDLIQALLNDTDIPRIRVSSLEPEDFQLHWLELWQNPRMCRHFHLPMQSGSDDVLRRMARRYKSDRYRTIIQTAKQMIPGVAISTDIITGFPGETDEDFEQTYALAYELEFAKSHVFRFSPRQGTAAARMRGQIKDEVKRARSQRLLDLNEQHNRLFREHFLGQTIPVLIEQQKNGYWEGLTDNYIRVELHNLPERSEGWQHTVVPACLDHLIDDGVFGIYHEN